MKYRYWVIDLVGHTTSGDMWGTNDYEKVKPYLEHYVVLDNREGTSLYSNGMDSDVVVPVQELPSI